MAQIVPLSSYQALSGKTVAISGCFDILHIGHIRFIEAARKKGDLLVVLLESDDFIAKYKMRKPFHNQAERAELLSHIREVDVVVLLPFMTKELMYIDMWKKVSPAIIALTAGDTYLNEKIAQGTEVGAKVVEVTPLIKGKSTTLALTFNPIRSVLD